MSSTTVASLADHVAAEVRSRLARDGVSVRSFAAQLGQAEHYVSRRIGLKRTIALDLNDLEQIAAALDAKPADLLP